MDRKRTVLAASGVSAVLVAGSSAFAVANGIFVSKPAYPVGTVAATKAPMRGAAIPSTVPHSPVVPQVSPSTRSTPTTQFRVIAPEQVRIPTSVPAIQPALARSITHSGPSAVSAAHEDDRETAEGGERDD